MRVGWRPRGSVYTGRRRTSVGGRGWEAWIRRFAIFSCWPKEREPSEPWWAKRQSKKDARLTKEIPRVFDRVEEVLSKQRRWSKLEMTLVGGLLHCPATGGGVSYSGATGGPLEPPPPKTRGSAWLAGGPPSDENSFTRADAPPRDRSRKNRNHDKGNTTIICTPHARHPTRHDTTRHVPTGTPSNFARPEIVLVQRLCFCCRFFFRACCFNAAVAASPAGAMVSCTPIPHPVPHHNPPFGILSSSSTTPVPFKTKSPIIFFNSLKNKLPMIQYLNVAC